MISIVDDDESIREATKELVKSLGYQALAFTSAEEFLRSDGVNETSCLISDVKMPGLGGIELYEHLITQGHLIPTIFITAFPEEGAQLRALTAGAVGFLSKPFSEESLLNCLEAALGRSGERIQQP